MVRDNCVLVFGYTSFLNCSHRLFHEAIRLQSLAFLVSSSLGHSSSDIDPCFPSSSLIIITSSLYSSFILRRNQRTLHWRGCVYREATLMERHEIVLKFFHGNFLWKECRVIIVLFVEFSVYSRVIKRDAVVLHGIHGSYLHLKLQVPIGTLISLCYSIVKIVKVVRRCKSFTHDFAWPTRSCWLAFAIFSLSLSGLCFHCISLVKETLCWVVSCSLECHVSSFCTCYLLTDDSNAGNEMTMIESQVDTLSWKHTRECWVMLSMSINQAVIVLSSFLSSCVSTLSFFLGNKESNLW